MSLLTGLLFLYLVLAVIAWSKQKRIFTLEDKIFSLEYENKKLQDKLEVINKLRNPNEIPHKSNS